MLILDIGMAVSSGNLRQIHILSEMRAVGPEAVLSGTLQSAALQQSTAATSVPAYDQRDYEAASAAAAVAHRSQHRQMDLNQQLCILAAWKA